VKCQFFGFGVVSHHIVAGAGRGCSAPGGFVPRTECNSHRAAAEHCCVQLECTSGAISKPQGRATCQLWAAEVPDAGVWMKCVFVKYSWKYLHWCSVQGLLEMLISKPINNTIVKHVRT
jgi:hypothetical protein